MRWSRPFNPGKRLTRFCSRIAVPIIAAALAALPAAPAGAATSGSGTLTITMSPGNSLSVTATPSTTSFSEDVTSPGTGWQFNSTQPWFPSGWTDAFTFTNGTSCTAVKVATSVHGWGLTAYYTTSPSTSLNVALAPAGTGTTCAAPAVAGTPIGNGSGNATTMLSSQNGTQTVNYYVVVQPTVAVTAPVTVTVTFTAQ